MDEPKTEMVGRYQLLAKLATGGMAEIFLARQTGIGGFEKLVVVKRILSHLAEERSFVEMFLDEAVIAAQLNHPNVVQIYDLGQAGDDYFIAMEYLEGESLGFMVTEGIKTKKNISPTLTAGIIAQVCDGLHYAHTFEDDSGQALQIVHRDISPHNVIVLFSGMVKLVDFGIAKAASQSHQTRVGTIKGKLAYMSPEQCLGKTVDARSDVFSLGVVLWEMLTRRRLFKRDAEPAMIRAIIDEPIPKVAKVKSDVPKALAEITDKCLVKEVDERMQSAADLAKALRAYLTDEGLEAGAPQIKVYAREVFGDRTRTKKKLLEEIRSRGADGISVRVLKPKSDSLPSSSVVGHTDHMEALAEAATRIKQEGDEPGSEVKAPSRSKSKLIWLGIPLFLLGIVLGGLILWKVAGSSGAKDPAVNANLDGPTPLLAPDAGSAVAEGQPDASQAPEPEPPTEAILSIRSNPEGCQVEIDAKPIDGSTPLDEVGIEPGADHLVAVLCEGHLRDERTVSGKAGEQVALAFAPAPKPTKPVKPVPPVGDRPPRPKPGPKDPVPKPEPKPEPVAKVVTGKLKLNTKPWSEIYLGKKKLGMTPLMGIDLPAGKHRLTAVNPARNLRKTFEVVIKPGKLTSKKIKLAE